MKRVKSSDGFTLLELIIVILLLGILGAVAAPRLLGLSSDARTAVMHGLKGALKDAANLVYAQALLAGVEESASASVIIDGVEVELAYGYPQSKLLPSNGYFEDDLVAWMGLDAAVYSDNDANNTTEWLLTDDVIGTDGITLDGSANGTAVGIILNSYQNAFCGVTYYESTQAGEAPTITLYDSGC